MQKPNRWKQEVLMVSLGMLSWNHIMKWLNGMDLLRNAEEAMAF
jgi:hypothetical protein